MKILHNPPKPEGADITNWNSGYEDINKPGGEVFDFPAGTTKAWEDWQAERIMETYSFLKEISEEEASKLAPKAPSEAEEEKPPVSKGYYCPECKEGFTSRSKLKKHMKETGHGKT